MPILAGEGVPHYSSAESETRLATKVTPQMPIEQGLSEHMDYSDTLNDSGILVLGSIDPGLVEKVRTHCESPNTKRSRYQRQTELEWNGDCDAVFECFDKVGSKDLYNTLRCSDLKN